MSPGAREIKSRRNIQQMPILKDAQIELEKLLQMLAAN